MSLWRSNFVKKMSVAKNAWHQNDVMKVFLLPTPASVTKAGVATTQHLPTMVYKRPPDELIPFSQVPASKT